MAHQPEIDPVEGEAGRAVAGRQPRRHAQAHRVDADQRAVGIVGNPDGARERPEVDAGGAELDVPGDPVRRRRDPVDGRSVAGERPHRALAGRNRPGLDRQRDARDDLAAGDSLDAPLPSAHHPGRAEAEREPVLRVRDRRAAADANGSRARQRRDRRREREHADAPEANRRRSDLRRESPAPGCEAGGARPGSGPARPGWSGSEAARRSKAARSRPARASAPAGLRASPATPCRPEGEPAAPTGARAVPRAPERCESKADTLANVSRKPYYLLRLS